jgi:hypothetical protein
MCRTADATVDGRPRASRVAHCAHYHRHRQQAPCLSQGAAPSAAPLPPCVHRSLPARATRRNSRSRLMTTHAASHPARAVPTSLRTPLGSRRRCRCPCAAPRRAGRCGWSPPSCCRGGAPGREGSARASRVPGRSLARSSRPRTGTAGLPLLVLASSCGHCC